VIDRLWTCMELANKHKEQDPDQATYVPAFIVASIFARRGKKTVVPVVIVMRAK
jgi:hypothetical protein